MTDSASRLVLSNSTLVKALESNLEFAAVVAVVLKAPVLAAQVTNAAQLKWRKR